MRNFPRVDVIIRARGYSALLSATVNSLLAQKAINLNIIIVNSSACDEGLSSLADHVVVTPYIASKFNYSEAINQAIPLLKNEFVLIISSHTSIRNPLAVSYGVSILRSSPLVAAANFSDQQDGDLSYRSVDISSFNGWNGTWNTGTLYRSKLLKDRPFRPNVLFSEDLEWSRWVLEHRKMTISHIIGCNCINSNPKKSSIAKKLMEWEFVSAYAYPPYLSLRFVASRLKFSLRLLLQFQFRESLIQLLVALVLIRVRLFGTTSKKSLDYLCPLSRLLYSWRE